MPLGRGQTLWLTGASVANAGSGALLQFAGILTLGAGASTDGYFAALTIPMVLSAIVIPAALNNLTPQLSGLDTQHRVALARQVLLRGIFPMLLGFGMVAATARWWLPGVFPGLDEPSRGAAVALSPLLCAVFAANVMQAPASAVLHAGGRFAFAESTQAGVALLALAIVVPATSNLGVVGFVTVLLCRSVTNFVLLSSPLLFARNIDVGKQARLFWLRSGEVIAGSSLFKLGPLVDRILASFLAPGVLTSFGLGQQVAGSAGSLTERVFSRPLLVDAGRCAASGERERIVAAYRRQARAVAISSVLAVASAGTVILLVSWFAPANLDAALEAMGHADIVVALALAAIPGAFGQLSAALLYALGDTRRLTRYATVNFLAANTCKVFGFLAIGAYGIVLGAILYQLLNWYVFHRTAMRDLTNA